MKRLNLSTLFAVFCLLAACGDNAPTPIFAAKTPISRYASNQELADCKEARHLIPVPGSYMKWEVIKTKDGEDSKLIGTNSVDGVWRVWGKDKMTKSEAEFTFDAGTTTTEDNLRDDRVKNVVFGLAQHAPFTFRLDSLEATDGADMKMPNGSAQELWAKGTLEIYGKKAPLSFAMIVKEQGGVYSIMPKGLVSINVRAMAGSTNGIPLAQHVEHVLTFVTGVSMKDVVTIDFNLAMKNACNKKI